MTARLNVDGPDELPLCRCSAPEAVLECRVGDGPVIVEVSERSAQRTCARNPPSAWARGRGYE